MKDNQQQNNTAADAPFRIRIRFAKKGDKKYLSHHDLMRFFERAIRRAGLPVRMSRGYNPRPKFSIAAALGVGIAAENEILDIEFDERLSPEVVRNRLADRMPPGIEINQAEALPRKGARVSAAWYEVTMPGKAEITSQAIDTLLEQDEVYVERTAKDRDVRRINIRPHILEIQKRGSTLRLHLAISANGAARPEEVIAVLAGSNPIDFRELEIVRTTLETEPDQQT